MHLQIMLKEMFTHARVYFCSGLVLLFLLSMRKKILEVELLGQSTFVFKF